MILIGTIIWIIKKEESFLGNHYSTIIVDPCEAYQHVYEETEALEFVFNIINTSITPVKIKRVIAGCGCTKVNLETYNLIPNQQTKLHVVYDVLSLFGLLPKREIKLIPEDPNIPVVKCTVGGFREQRFKLTPPSVNFGKILIGETPSCEVSIKVFGPDIELMPEKIVSNNSWITMDVHKKITSSKDETEWIVNIGLKKDTPQGEIRGNVYIPRIQDDGIGPIVSVMGEVTGPVQLIPPEVFMGILSNDNPEGIITVKARPIVSSLSQKSVESISITGFGTVPPGLSLSILEQSSATISVTATSSQINEGKFDEKIIVKCLVDGQPYEVLLRVHGLNIH